MKGATMTTAKTAGEARAEFLKMLLDWHGAVCAFGAQSNTAHKHLETMLEWHEAQRTASAEPVPDGVWEALQRLIENAAPLGPSSADDAFLVARYRHRLLAPQPSAEPEIPAPHREDELQARIDALMLEYCPEEMTAVQRAKWAQAQKPIDQAKIKEIKL
jgi:hypothetical protein